MRSPRLRSHRLAARKGTSLRTHDKTPKFFQFAVAILISFGFGVMVGQQTVVSRRGELEVPTEAIVQEETLVVSPTVSPTKKLDDGLPMRLLLIHIGYSGGETLKQTLNAGCLSMSNKLKRDECLKKLPASALSSRIGGYRYEGRTIPRRAAPEADGFVLLLRHPLLRFLSWYDRNDPSSCDWKAVYRGPRCTNSRWLETEPNSDRARWVAKFYSVCFPKIESMRSVLNSTNLDTKTNECRLTLLSLFLGKESVKTEVPVPLLFNLEYHLKTSDIPHSDKTTYILRTESLWSDAKKLDRLLGGTGDFGGFDGTQLPSRNSDHNQSKIDPGLSRLLCCGLQGEIHHYRRMIDGATNLAEDERKETSTWAVETCGFQFWRQFASTCDAFWVSQSNVTVFNETKILPTLPQTELTGSSEMQANSENHTIHVQQLSNSTNAEELNIPSKVKSYWFW